MKARAKCSLAIALAALSACAKEAGEARAPDPAERGLALLEAGDYVRAAESLRAAYRAAPSQELRLALARALIAAGDPGAALRALAEDAPESSADDMLRAAALFHLGRYDEARAAAGAAAAGPYAGRAALIAARVAHLEGARAEARAALARALRLGGEARGEAWLFRARLALEDGALAAARAAARRASEAGAGARAVEAVEIEALIREGDFGAARAALRAREKRPGVSDPYTDYLHAMLAAAQDDAREAVRRAGAAEPFLTGEPRGRVFLALIRAWAGGRAQAEALFASAAARAPGDPLAGEAEARFFIEAGRPDAAERAARRLAAARPPEARATARLLLVEIAARRGALDAAFARALEGGQAGAPGPGPAAMLLGPYAAPARAQSERRARSLAWLAAGDALARESEAEEIAGALAALAPYADDPLTDALAGALLLRAGDEAGARVRLEAAAAAPGFWAPLARLVALAPGEAGPRLDAFIAANPDHAPARLERARLLQAQGRAGAARDALAPAADGLAHDAAGARLYAALLDETGDEDGLQAFADALRRRDPAGAGTIAALAAAGRHEAAAGAARRALAAGAGDATTIAAYARAMREIGRGAEAAAFLRALAAGRPALAEEASRWAAFARSGGADAEGDGS
ncbi:hypothetical protein [Amphiplicatus metriothermophilus]|uniref:Tetratricopeptide repeat-containing protein n=1 Tax=Amphiplicatus metriothermophilus TaxID=1519374 RepID=A0A239PSJ8_9PROT|nr:hypothetical protein [Amphiplicatus metriothermophilus]MBB5519192.1 Tfp pilus assembly protein PilF [Amphiplicatus metriothermophilus]SNT73261.1 hypothetical protein SAMN06297382_1659 [Amphiplicatus metriothermophilus]